MVKATVDNSHSIPQWEKLSIHLPRLTQAQQPIKAAGIHLERSFKMLGVSVHVLNYRHSVAARCLRLQPKVNLDYSLLVSSESAKLEIGYAHLSHLKQNHSSGACYRCLSHIIQKFCKSDVMSLDDCARAEQSHDSWLAVNTAEHDGDTSVLVDVGDCFDPGSGGINIGYVISVKDVKCRRGEPFGREINVPTMQGRRRGEEERLFQSPFLQAFGYRIVKMNHVVLSERIKRFALMDS
ncbi:hypothetical protein E5D57_000093 [Metarhizium anisopliae]|nr:hypothetical protein E5D57_000093 [Metarhizium anisopliae]